MSRIHVTHIALVALGIFLLCAGSALLLRKNQDSIDYSKGVSGTSHERSLFWEEAIREQGGFSVYKKFARTVDNLTEKQKHAQAHIFGQALFNAEGIRGLPVCDSRFLFGCFHEFIGTATTELGLPIVPKLNDTCIEILGAESHYCQHGLGHGLVSYFGYSDTDLDKALEMCRKLPNNDYIGGCYGGIFMEYNMRTMLADEGEVRSTDNIFDPCDRLPVSDLPACYFWISDWWRGGVFSAEKNEAVLYQKMGESCHGFKGGRELLNFCFMGIGNGSFVPEEDEINHALSSCDMTSENPQDYWYCRLGVINRASILEPEERIKTGCSGVSEKHEQCELFMQQFSL